MSSTTARSSSLTVRAPFLCGTAASTVRPSWVRCSCRSRTARGPLWAFSARPLKASGFSERSSAKATLRERSAQIPHCGTAPSRQDCTRRNQRLRGNRTPRVSAASRALQPCGTAAAEGVVGQCLVHREAPPEKRVAPILAARLIHVDS